MSFLDDRLEVFGFVVFENVLESGLGDGGQGLVLPAGGGATGVFAFPDDVGKVLLDELSVEAGLGGEGPLGGVVGVLVEFVQEEVVNAVHDVVGEHPDWQLL